MPRKYIKGGQQQGRSYSKAVITRGGTTVYLAGVGGANDAAGNLIRDFEGQARRALERLGENLVEAGAKLSDMTTMTVFLTDARFGDRFVAIRSEYFADDNFPGSALITVAGLARPEMLLEIQGIAVIDDA